MGSVYYCEIWRSFNGAMLIKSTSGNHWGGNDNANVTYLISDGYKMKNIPRNLDKIFPNLKGIKIRFGHLQVIRQFNFKPFPELVYLDLNNNNLHILEEGLFDFNPKLIYISINNNNFAFIHPNVFDGLKSLTSLYLQSSGCINEYTSYYGSNIQEVVQIVKQSCSNLEKFVKLNESLTKLEKDYDNLNFQNYIYFKDDYEKLKAKLESSSIKVLQSRFNNLKYKMEDSDLWKTFILIDKRECGLNEVKNGLNKAKIDLENIKKDVKSHKNLLENALMKIESQLEDDGDY